MRETLTNEKGYSLFLTLLTIMLIAVLGISLITIATNAMSFSISERGNQSSFYIAEAGLTSKRAEVQLLVEEAFMQTHEQFEALSSPQEKASFDFEQKYFTNVQSKLQSQIMQVDNRNYDPQQGEIPESEAVVSLVSTEPLVYNVQSTGMVPLSSGRTQEKVLNQLMEVKLNVPYETVSNQVGGEKVTKIKACFSLYTTGDLYHSTNSLKGPIYVSGTTYIERGGAFIDGNIYSVGDIRITGGGSGINGDAYTTGKVTLKNNSKVNGQIFESVNINQVQNECVQEKPELPNLEGMFPSPPMNALQTAYNQNGDLLVNSGVLSLDNWKLDNSTWVLSEDIYLKRLHIPSSRTLTIDLNNQDRTLYVDEWDISNGFIDLKNASGSKLKIIIKNSLNHQNGDLNKNGASNNVEVFYAGSSEPKLGGNSVYNADFHIKKADLKVSGSNGLMGDIIHYGTDSTITVSGHGDMGNKLILAPNSNFYLTGSGKIIGNIIAKNFTASGAGSISPPSQDSGEWEYNEGQSETIEYNSYEEQGTLMDLSPPIEE